MKKCLMILILFTICFSGASLATAGSITVNIAPTEIIQEDALWRIVVYDTSGNRVVGMGWTDSGNPIILDENFFNGQIYTLEIKCNKRNGWINPPRIYLTTGAFQGNLAFSMTYTPE